jgi:hypothetical protein
MGPFRESESVCKWLCLFPIECLYIYLYCARVVSFAKRIMNRVIDLIDYCQDLSRNPHETER